MSLRTAVNLWGADVAARALADDAPEPVTQELAREVSRHAGELTDAAFARWALALPWPRFCAVVRIAAGVTRTDLLKEDA